MELSRLTRFSARCEKGGWIDKSRDSESSVCTVVPCEISGDRHGFKSKLEKSFDPKCAISLIERAWTQHVE